MTMTEKMRARAKTFREGQMLDQELIYMVMDGLAEVSLGEQGGWTLLKARLTEKGKQAIVVPMPGPVGNVGATS